MKKFLITLVLIIAIIVVLAMFFAGSIVRQAATSTLPRVLGVPVNIENVDVNIFGGSVEINGMVVGNPAGFTAPSVFEIRDVRVSLSLSSLATDVVTVNEVYIAAPKITYEISGHGTNVNVLKKNVERNTANAGTSADTTEPKSADEPAKKLIIEHFEIAEASLCPVVAGRGTCVTLPTMTLKNIGKEEEGTTAQKVANEVLSMVTNTVAKVSPAQLVGGAKNVKNALEQMRDGAKGAADSIKDLGGKLKDMF